METNELKQVFEAVLSAPGMEDNVKIDFRISRKVALFLATVIERGLDKRGAPGSDLLSLSSAVSREELEGITRSILEKSGLTELHGRMGRFMGKQ